MDEQPEGVYRIITYIVSTVVLFSLGFLFWQNHMVFTIFEYVVFAAVLAVVIDFTIRRITRFTWRDIGQQGTIGQGLIGKVKTYTPLAVHAGSSQKSTKITPVVPKVADMLREQLLDGVTLYLGYTITEDKAEPYTGTFNDVRTFAIAGKGGSGKTVRLFFLLLQCVLANAVIFLCDPHGSDAGSISAMLAPLSQWVHFAVSDFRGDIEAQIMRMVVEFKDTMERRVHGIDTSRRPCVLVVDEATRMIFHDVYGAEFVDICCKVADEYRKFGGYLIVVGQSWTAAGRGKKVTDLLARLKRALHAKFVHRLDKEYAKYFMQDSRLLKRIDHLPTRQCFFFDTEGQFHELYTPYGTISDAFTVAKMMQAIEAPAPQPQLQQVYIREQIAQHHATRPLETFSFQNENSAQLSLPEPEMKSFHFKDDKLAEIKRLRGLNFNQSQIIQNIWKVKPGATQAYQSALAEYKQLLDELVRSA